MPLAPWIHARSGLSAAGLAATALLVGASPALAIDEIPDGMTQESVADELLETIGTELSESRSVAAEYLDPGYTPWVTLIKDAQVSTTFVDEGAGYRNSLGYFAFSDDTFAGLSKADVDIDGSGVVSLAELAAVEGVETGWVFPNSSLAGSGGQLRPGDTVQIGDGQTFSAGTNIGFSLVQNGWTGSDIRQPSASGDTTPQMMYSVDFLNPEAGGSTAYGSDSSVDSSRHVALMYSDASNANLIMGFEDLNRVDRRANAYNYTSDNDFNDAVFVVASNPFDAIQGTNVYAAPAPKLGSLLSPSGLAGMLAVAAAVAWRRRRGA